MNIKLSLIAAALAIASLTSCGGGKQPEGPVIEYIPGNFEQTDTLAGTGAVAAAPKIAGVYYTGYKYSSEKADHKGDVFDSRTSGEAFFFQLGGGRVIAGFDRGVTGMKVGGKRTVIIPQSQAYGANGHPAAGIGPNQGLVFDIELVSVQ